jgi:YD repeat-containing protein
MTFGFDWADRPSAITSTAYSGTMALNYGLDGLLVARTLPGSAGTDSVAYDAAKRPIDIDRSVGSVSISRSWDRDGNVASEGRSFGCATADACTNVQYFDYDSLGRVVAGTDLAAGDVTYEYDLDGNRTRKVEPSGTTTITYDRADQAISQLEDGVGTAFTYDTSGNMTKLASSISNQTSLEYDTAGRLVKMAPASGNAATFTFDALGRTKTRTVGGVADTYAYLGLSETVHQVVTDNAALDSPLGPSGERLALKAKVSIRPRAVHVDLHSRR